MSNQEVNDITILVESKRYDNERVAPRGVSFK